jgi:DNA invertase Pin-like site-specific DNA recombinase
MKIGYARVSTDDQNPALQIAALKRVGCKRIFTDTASGASRKRPELDKCLKALTAGDVLTVWKIDRLGRSLLRLVGVMESLKGQGVGFRSLTEAIDTESATGRLLSHIIGALSEFERSLIIERTQAGLKAAKRRGVKLWRKPKLTPPQIAHARKLIEGGDSPAHLAGLLGVARSTLYAALAPVGQHVHAFLEAAGQTVKLPHDNGVNLSGKDRGLQFLERFPLEGRGALVILEPPYPLVPMTLQPRL